MTKGFDENEINSNVNISLNRSHDKALSILGEVFSPLLELFL